MLAAVRLQSSGPATRNYSANGKQFQVVNARRCSSAFTYRWSFGQRPERPSAGGVAAAASGRAAASQQRRKTTKDDESPRRCPCGSGLGFSECCQPIVEGAWARNPPELARARFTAMQLGNAQLLADTTHPESLKAIGTKQQLLRKWEAEMRVREAHQPSMVDMAFAQDPQDEDCWYVLSALSYPDIFKKKSAKDSSRMVYVVVERYVKEAGRWCFYEFPRSYPSLEPLVNFIDKYEGNDSVVQVGLHAEGRQEGTGILQLGADGGASGARTPPPGPGGLCKRWAATSSPAGPWAIWTWATTHIYRTASSTNVGYYVWGTHLARTVCHVLYFSCLAGSSSHGWRRRLFTFYRDTSGTELCTYKNSRRVCSYLPPFRSPGTACTTTRGWPCRPRPWPHPHPLRRTPTTTTMTSRSSSRGPRARARAATAGWWTAGRRLLPPAAGCTWTQPRTRTPASPRQVGRPGVSGCGCC